MALPAGVLTTTVTFGPYTDVIGGAALVGLRGTLRPSSPIVHVPSGQVLVAAEVPITIEGDGSASVGPIPRCGQAGVLPEAFTYTVDWAGSSYVASPGRRTFQLPEDSPAIVDFDLLTPVPTAPGMLVPTVPGPPGPPGGVATVAGRAGDIVLTASDVSGMFGDDQIPASIARDTEVAAATSAAVSTAGAAVDHLAAAAMVNPASELGAASRAAYLPRWSPATAYAQGDIVLSPTGAIVRANAAFTSASSYNAANWTVVAVGGGLTVTATATAAGALVGGKHTPVDATAGALSMALPSGQAAGTMISVEKTDAGANAVTLTGNLRGLAAQSIALPWAREALLLVADAAGSWWPVAGHKTKTALDAAYLVPAATSTATGRVALAGELAGPATAPVLRTKARNERRRIPSLARYPDAKVGTLASVGLSTIYVPWLIRVPDSVFAAFPQYGRWRCYTSTDHDTGDGGIAIGVCMTDDIENPANWSWLRLAGSPVMFKDGSNRQTETPCVVWNPITGLFHLYYQIAVGTTQTTRVATSPNGVDNWTIVGDAIANLPTSVAGWNHTGYARVYYLDGIWACWHLQGSGTAVSAYGWSWSLDGFKWVTDRRRVGAAVQLTDGVLRMGISSLVDFRGELWAVGTQTEYTSGAATSTVNNVWAAPISRENDLRTLKGRPQLISPADTSALGVPTAWAEHPDGRLFGAYRLDGATGSLALAVLA